MSEILELWGYIWDIDNDIDNCIAAIDNMWYGVDPEDDSPELVELEKYCKMLKEVQTKIKADLPHWIKEAAQSEEELLADLDARADALSY